MQYIVMIAVVFFGLLLFPFLCAWHYSRKEGQVLYINQNQVRDARYFGKSFSKLIEQNLSSLTNGTMFLSKQEAVLDADTEAMPQEVTKVVLCFTHDFVSPKDTKVFQKEIYGRNNVQIVDGGVKVRAVYAQQTMLLGEQTKVVRWADAQEQLVVKDGCQLGVSASAGKKLIIGKNCTFRRLYAPEILIGQDNDTGGQLESERYVSLLSMYEAYYGADKNGIALEHPLEIKRNIEYVDKNLLDGKETADFTIVSKDNVMLLEHIILKGDLRSHKSVRICDNAVVFGNIFAEETIYIGKNAIVFGNIFSQADIYFENDSIVGRRGKIVSVVARGKILFESRATVFGYISCEGGGMVKATSII